MAAEPPTILVVDDEFAPVEVLALLLTGEGFRVLTASDGEAALERLAESEVELVITDYKMPKMDGLELCAHLLADASFREIPVILMSASYRRDAPRPRNVRAFFGKPLSFPPLLATVRQILPRKSPA